MTRRAWMCVLAVTLVIAACAAPASAAPGDTAEPRIVGGQTSAIQEYPWQAGLLVAGSGNAFNRQYCGGSLLTERIVITAAHCLRNQDPDCSSDLLCSLPTQDPGGDGTEKIDPNDLEVLLGVSTLSTATESDDYGVYPDHGAISVHPGYNAGTFVNDIGYVVLTGGVMESPSIKTIDIAGGGETDLWEPGMFVEISGWGTTVPGQQSSKSNTLRAASVPIVGDSTCAQPSFYGADFHQPTMVCAGFAAGGIDTCQGDSGGPLQAPIQTPDGEYRLVGITSWGDGCAKPNKPGVYTRIAQGGGLREEVATAVLALEAEFSLPHEDIIGAGGTPKSGGPKYPVPGTQVFQPDPGVTQTEQPKADPYKKCRKLFNKKKRKQCNRKVKRNLGR